MRFTLAFLLILTLLAVSASGRQRKSKVLKVINSTGVRRRIGRVGVRANTNSGRSTNTRRRVRPRFFGLLSGLGSSSGSSSSLISIFNTTSSGVTWPAARCTVPTSGCNTSGTNSVCAHWGASLRQCKLFPNRCLMETANCRKTVSSWNVVRYANCTNLDATFSGNCVSTFTGTSVASTSSSTNSWTSLFGSNVSPIIINTG